jgi:hypothetical protein
MFPRYVFQLSDDGPNIPEDVTEPCKIFESGNICQDFNQLWSHVVPPNTTVPAFLNLLLIHTLLVRLLLLFRNRLKQTQYCECVQNSLI